MLPNDVRIIPRYLIRHLEWIPGVTEDGTSELRKAAIEVKTILTLLESLLMQTGIVNQLNGKLAIVELGRVRIRKD